MIGALANRPRVLRLAAEYADVWNAWLAWDDNSPAAISPLRTAVDAACREVGRDPATLRRSISTQIDYPGGRETSGPGARPLTGTPAELAEILRGFAREGISDVQIVLNPNTLASVARFAPTLAILDADRS
jgi:alkanesulfonate monooxygenase SsuD/methylene tetrahydromethanopterin reductase-like flavin-dependent oxidoreductase (luciferase family)